jgi:hypothetical protein
VGGLAVTDLRTSVQEERVHAIARFGFTERQARFLVHVMVYGGVFLNRQYCAFAGISHGQKTHDFLRKLVDRGYATVITPGALHRGRLVHVHYKPLYEAIGEANNRNRRPASLGRMIERLMILDAVLSDRGYLWLGTERDKLAYFKDSLGDRCRLEGLPRVTFGEGRDKTFRYFPDKLPIGVEADHGTRHVFLYLVTRDVPVDFRMFVFRHVELLKMAHYWTIRVLVPRRFRKAVALYRHAAREELAPNLTPTLADELEWVFRHRAGTADVAQMPAGLDLAAAARKFRGARFRARYRMWQLDHHLAMWNLWSFILRDQLTRGEGRIEVMELPHQYLRLTSLVGVS